MGLLDRLLHGPALASLSSYADPANMGAAPTPVTPATSLSNGDSWPSGMQFEQNMNGLYCREYAVRTVVDFIVRNIASLPLKVYRKDANGDPVEVNSGSFHQLMKRPSMLPGASRYRFVQRLLEDMLLEDKWLCMLGMDADGTYSLRRMPPGSYHLSANAFGEIQQVRIDGHGVIPDKTYPLPDPRIILDIGYVSSLQFGSPISSVLQPLLAESRALMRYRENIAKNGGQIPGYVFRPKEMPWPSQDEYDEFTQGMRNYTQSGGQAGFMPTLKDGMEIRAVENIFKPVDMNDLEARNDINIAVATAFQISPENIGFRTGTNSNIAAYKEKLWNVELLPYITAFEEALNLTLPDAVGEPDRYVKANLDSKLRGTMETQYQALSTATGRPFMTTNYARRLLDMQPVDGGDQLVTPMNVEAGGQPSPQDGGRTQNAQTGSSPNGKTGEALAMFDEFKRLHRYDAGFQHEWDAMKGQSDEI
jgi:HK97 family phage portal protein